MNAMDFDDLLVRTVNVLELFPEVRARYAAAFRHVLVDEYQDTNHAQYRLLQLIAGEHRNLAVVGDDDQSIYSFRGADITNILNFQDDFPDADVVRLEQNYRSTQTILDAANAVITPQPRADGQDAVDGPGRGRSGQGPRARRRARRGAVRGGRDRAARRRGRLARGDRDLLPDQRAVAGARGHAGAPRDRLPGHRRHEVLRARRDQGRDRLPDRPGQPAGRRLLHAVANSPKRGIGQTSLSRVLAHAETMGIPVWEAAADPAAVPGLGTAAVRALRALHGDHGRAARARRAAGPDRRPARGDAARDRLPRRARGRADDRGAGAHREPPGARRGRARVRRPAEPRTTRSTSSCSRSRWSPTPTPAATTRAS